MILVLEQMADICMNEHLLLDSKSDSTPHPTRQYKLGRKWPAHNLIGNGHVGVLLAVNTPDHLMAHLCTASTYSDMDLLFSFTVLAFNRHNDVTLVGHR